MGEIIVRPIPATPMPFSGERLTSEYGGQTEIEHLHRYLFAREWCRDKDVLDIASGEGYGTALLAQVAKSAVGVEIAPDAVAHAQASYVRDNLTYMQGDARAIPVADASRDIVTSFETIEHFAEQAQFLREVRRVLRPGGLFVVSTPDRDNYSPTGSMVNKYHVKEMTGAEFDDLLRSQFPEVLFVMQRPVLGSVLLPTVAGSAASLCFEKRGPTHFEASVGLARPQYFVAFASDVAISSLPPSVYIDTGQLGVLTPEEMAARLAAAQASAASEREAHAGARAAAAALDQRVAALTVELAEARGAQKAYQAELANARAEIAVSAAANEMAEKACAAYRIELAQAKSAAAASAAVDTGLATRVRQLEDEVAILRMSHSWRVTAPLRQISRMLYRRQ